MKQALDGLKKLNDRSESSSVTGNVDFNPGWHTALDLRNLLTVSEAITRSAIERKESRGGQFRDDYPNKDPEFAKFNIAVKEVNGEMQISHIPLPEMPTELKQVIEEMG
jgi:succinate dehydrogenase / fumarate reductase flavoprotein subunit